MSLPYRMVQFCGILTVKPPTGELGYFQSYTRWFIQIGYGRCPVSTPVPGRLRVIAVGRRWPDGSFPPPARQPFADW